MNDRPHRAVRVLYHRAFALGGLPHLALDVKARRVVRVGDAALDDEVGAEEDAVRAADEELPRALALAGQFADGPFGGGRVDVEPREALHHCVQIVEVLRPAAHMDADVSELGMGVERALDLREILFLWP